MIPNWLYMSPSPWSPRINFIPFRIFRYPLFHKPVTGQDIFFLFLTAKPALVKGSNFRSISTNVQNFLFSSGLYNLPLLQIYKIETAPEYTIINLKPPNTHTHTVQNLFVLLTRVLNPKLSKSKCGYALWKFSKIDDS